MTIFSNLFQKNNSLIYEAKVKRVLERELRMNGFSHSESKNIGKNLMDALHRSGISFPK